MNILLLLLISRLHLTRIHCFFLLFPLGDLTINQFLSTLQLEENEAVYYDAKPLITQLTRTLSSHDDEDTHNNANIDEDIQVKDVLSDLYKSAQPSDSLELFVHDKSSTEAGRRAVENLVK